MKQDVEKVTNISNKVLEHAEYITKVLPKAMKFIQDDIIICHNAEFIMMFLKYYCKKLGIKIYNESIDTLQLYRRLYPEQKSYRIAEICKMIGINNIEPKGTLQTAYIVMYLFEHYRKQEQLSKNIK